MQDYVVFDLENPNFRQNSICSIGLLVVRDNIIEDKIDLLINPEDSFDNFNINFTGISPSMVVDSPTFKEVWPEIKYLLTREIVVGHNITYDLRVISKSLQRYNIDVPEFDYCCTLSLSRRFLDLPSYKLENVAKSFNFTYDAHVAIEDAIAAYKVFEHINNIHEITYDDCRHFKYRPKVKEAYDPKLSTNINNLYGMIYILKYKNNYSNNHYNLLDKWYKENIIFSEYSLFNDITNNLKRCLDDDVLYSENINFLTKQVPCINQSNIYSSKTLQTQVLQGIIKTITCDNRVTLDEINYLYTWLQENTSLRGSYPYDKIVHIVEYVVDKQRLTSDEERKLSDMFRNLMTPVKKTCESIDFENKTYCLTGDFKHGSKSEIEELLNKKGLIKKSSVSSKVDYLFVGDLGSPAWKYGNIGGKIVKAQQLQDKGCKIKIISESNLFKEI